jgi:hypothetical protein
MSCRAACQLSGSEPMLGSAAEDGFSRPDAVVLGRCMSVAEQLEAGDTERRRRYAGPDTALGHRHTDHEVNSKSPSCADRHRVGKTSRASKEAQEDPLFRPSTRLVER